MHNPVWSVRANRSDRWIQAESIRNTFHALFVDHGVDRVFSGYDHQYYRTVRDDINYVVTGGGGAPLYDIQTEDTVWQDGDVGFSEYHYCVATADVGELKVEVFLMNGTIADSFTFDLPIPLRFPIEIVLSVSMIVAVVIILEFRRGRSRESI